MSATVTMTMTQSSSMASLSAVPCCPKCGFDMDLPPLHETQGALLSAQKQIEDLQAQVRLLNQKATAAVDRWADYEDELARLRSAVAAANSRAAAATAPPPPIEPQGPPSPSRSPASSFLPQGAANRISALLSPRSAKSTPDLKAQAPASPYQTPGGPRSQFSPAIPMSPTLSTDELLNALSREQSLRLQAEGKLNDTSREVEELSVQLFEQANEMVATERRARAKLEERVEVLEKRDTEKRRRLDKIEQAMDRIDRVRALIGETGQ